MTPLPYAGRLGLRSLRSEWPRSLAVTAGSALVTLLILAAGVALPVAESAVHATALWSPVKAADADHQSIVVSFQVEPFTGHDVQVVRVFAAEGSTVAVPGVPHAPRPGTIFASPAALTRFHEDPEFRRRYPGEIVGPIARSALAGPHSLMVVIGGSKKLVKQLGGVETAGFVTGGATDLTVPSAVRVGAPIMVTMLVVPLLWLLRLTIGIGSVYRSRREQALELLGCPAGMASLLRTIEASVAALLGGVIACAVFVFVLARLGPHIPLGDGAWPDALRPSPALGVAAPLLTAVLVAVMAGSIRSPRDHVQYSFAPSLRSGLASLGLSLVSLVASVHYPSPEDTTPRLVLLIIGFLAAVTGLIRWSRGKALGLIVATRARSLPALLGGRALIARGGTSLSVGLALSVCASGILFAVFPLLSESGSRDRQVAASHLGADTFTVQVADPALLDRLTSSPAVQGFAELWPSATGEGPATLVCRDLLLHALPGGPQSCDTKSTTVTRAIVEALNADGLAPPSLVWAPEPPRTSSAPESGVLVFVQPRPGQREPARTDALRLLQINQGRVDTLGERAARAALNSRPYVLATWVMLTLTWLVGLASVIAGLSTQILDARDTICQLHIVGAAPSRFTRGLLIQTLTAVGPLILIAWIVGLAVAWSFLRLNAGSLTLPWLQTAVVAVMGIIASALGAASCHPFVLQASMSKEPHE